VTISLPTNEALRKELTAYAMRELLDNIALSSPPLMLVSKPKRFPKMRPKPLQRRSANMRKHQKIRKLSTVRRIRIRRPNRYTQTMAALMYPITIQSASSVIKVSCIA
jgi:hypothetical protein